MKLVYANLIMFLGVMTKGLAVEANEAISLNLPFEGEAKYIFLPYDEPSELISVDKDGHAFLQTIEDEDTFDLGKTSAEPAISANGRFFASFSGRSLKVWDLNKKQLSKVVNFNFLWSFLQPLSLSISPEGQYICLIDKHQGAYLIDIKASLPLLRAKKFADVTSANFGIYQNGREQVAFGKSDGSVIVYNLNTMEAQCEHKYSRNPPISKLSLINDQQLASTGVSLSSIRILSRTYDFKIKTIGAPYAVANDGYEFPLDAYNLFFSADGQKYLYLYQDQNDYGYCNAISLEFGYLDEGGNTKIKNTEQS